MTPNIFQSWVSADSCARVFQGPRGREFSSLPTGSNNCRTSASACVEAFQTLCAPFVCLHKQSHPLPHATLPLYPQVPPLPDHTQQMMRKPSSNPSSTCLRFGCTASHKHAYNVSLSYQTIHPPLSICPVFNYDTSGATSSAPAHTAEDAAQLAAIQAMTTPGDGPKNIRIRAAADALATGAAKDRFWDCACTKDSAAKNAAGAAPWSCSCALAADATAPAAGAAPKDAAVKPAEPAKDAAKPAPAAPKVRVTFWVASGRHCGSQLHSNTLSCVHCAHEIALHPNPA